MKKKPVRTRKQKAIRWAVLLIVVVSLGQIMGMNCLFPQQTVGKICQTMGMKETQIICGEWGRYYPMRTKRVYLSGNDTHFLLTAATFNPLAGGWYNVGPGMVIDPSDPECRDAAWYVRKQNGDACICFAGFVPEGETSPTFSVGVYAQGESYVEGMGYDRFDGEPVDITPVADIPVEAGHCYLEMYPFETRNDAGERQGCLFVRNTDGNLSEMNNHMFTFFS